LLTDGSQKKTAQNHDQNQNHRLALAAVTGQGLPEPAPPPDSATATSKSQRSTQDAQALLGVATTNVVGRVMASIGKLPGGAPVRFEPCEDVSCGGVLAALPALMACGLLRHSSRYFRLPEGYYTLANVFILLGFMALNRINTMEQLRRCAPGEWGKVLGLDRCPGVETLRKKLGLITASGDAVEDWSAELARDWMKAESLEHSTGGLLYLVDGHVRVYHGSQTKLPKHHVARQRLCLRATTDYWVNQVGGTPVFKINQIVDPGMIEVLRTQIVPRLESDIPNQPTPEQLEADPMLPRFTIVFDREGYSPALFKELLETKRIACQTYRKGACEGWPEDEFIPTQVRLNNGQSVTWKLAERGLLLGAKKTEQSWVREVRKLSDRGHQSSVLGTNFKLETAAVAGRQFGRWSQENFFRYASQSMDLDRLIDYQLTSVPDTVQVINPRWRQLDGEARKAAGQLAKLKAQFGALTLKEEIDEGKVEAFLESKNALKAGIEEKQQELEKLKSRRRAESRKVAMSELPEEERFESLNNRGKHFVDTIKIVAYRAETALAQILAETMHAHHRDEARGLARQILATEANLRPDPQAGTLTVEIHGLSTPRDDAALEHLCAELTETRTIYPGTELRLIYKKVS
jgi:hypothetical protein